MKNIKFDHNKDKGRPGSTWWDMIMGLTNTVSVRMVEEKFSVQRKDDQETIFDLVLRTGLAPDFQAAVALLFNTFPLPSPPMPFWKKILLKIPVLNVYIS